MKRRLRTVQSFCVAIGRGESRQNKRSTPRLRRWKPLVRDTDRSKRIFVTVWALVALLKLGIATRLPLFVDEAFYWQEGRHLALAYSDLPGFTAWVCRLGEELFGRHLLGLRLPFLAMGAALPWLVVALARAARLAPAQTWQAGTLAALLPLAGTLGVMALPDVPLALATLLCLIAGVQWLRAPGTAAAALLALGLALGALTHYRFIAVIGVGFLALLSLPQGRRALGDARLWLALLVGAAAWLPLLGWNWANADAGLRFQLVDRHPWALHAGGAAFPLVQAMWATPLLLIAMLMAARRDGGWRGAGQGAEPAGVAASASGADATHANHDEADLAARRFLARAGAGVLLGFFLLGFVADAERSSFHWPLPAYLALLPLVPALLAGWSTRWRRALWVLTGFGLCAALAYSAAIASPTARAAAAASRQYPANFAGWDELAEAVTAARSRMPAGTRLLADNFKIGAELGFVFDDPAIDVLDHPQNVRHGRAPQLALWGLLHRDRGTLGAAPRLLVVGSRDVDYKHLLRRYHDLCTMLGPLPPPQVLNIDRGRKRYLLFALPAQRASGPCTLPAMAWLDAPGDGDTVSRRFTVDGWAFKDGVGLARVEVLIDGRPVATARYGLPRPDVAGYWKISRDPQHPNVAFRAEVDAGALPPGRHWLGLRLHGRDGSVEDWWEQPFELRP